MWLTDFLRRFRVDSLKLGPVTLKPSIDRQAVTDSPSRIDSVGLTFVWEYLHSTPEAVSLSFSLVNRWQDREVTVSSIGLELLGIVLHQPLHRMTRRARLRDVHMRQLLDSTRHEPLFYNGKPVRNCLWRPLLDSKRVLQLQKRETQSFRTHVIRDSYTVGEISFHICIKYFDNIESILRNLYSNEIFFVNFSPTGSDGRTFSEKLQYWFNMDVTLLETFPGAGSAKISSKTAKPLCSIENKRQIISLTAPRFLSHKAKSIDFLTVANLKDRRSIKPLRHILDQKGSDQQKMLAMLALLMIDRSCGALAIREVLKRDDVSKRLRKQAHRFLDDLTEPKED